jgi:protein phosphatase
MVRSGNEDSFASDPHGGLAILADGMGGHNAGEIASNMATAVIANAMRDVSKLRLSYELDPRTGKSRAEELLRTHIATANASVHGMSQSQAQYAGMGTTLVVALFYDNKVTVAHIGDSRLYRLRGTELLQVTKDHSLLQEQIDAGLLTPEQAEQSNHKNLVTRALGVDATVEPEIHDHDALPGDIYLLCSDGLSDMVSDEDIATTLRASGADLKSCAHQLVNRANEHGGRDNISVILVRVLREYAAERGILAGIRDWLR